MESYLVTSWIDLATATVHQKLMGNVPTMESAEKFVWHTKQLAKYVMIPILDNTTKTKGSNGPASCLTTSKS
jgi:hypothetical protein